MFYCFLFSKFFFFNFKFYKLKLQLVNFIQLLVKNLMLHPEDLTDAELGDLYVEMDDFLASLRTILPTIKQEGFISVSDITWNDIGALKEVRDELKWSILVRFINNFNLK